MFSDLVVAYLFLGGTGAGCCLIASILALLAEPTEIDRFLVYGIHSASAQTWRRFFSALYIAALGALFLGAICLMADLGRPDKLLLLLFYPTPTYMAVGTWFIIVCSISALLCVVLWAGHMRISRKCLTVLSIIAGVSSIVVMVYTGLMLSDIRAIPVWNTFWLVLLFVLSALSCGIALALCSSLISGSLTAFYSTLVRLSKVDAAIILIEAAVGFFCLFSVWSAAGGLAGPADSTGQAAFDSLESLLVGPLAVTFWVGFAFIGLAVPFVQDIAISRKRSNLMRMGKSSSSALFILSTAACVLFGGALLRFLVVQAAMQPIGYLVS
ncbi:NrfD/PsrC family molybdoenzyme membrane anchor subunit [Adlercreutzia sp. ZJ304]|uniref:NrfD/PsrC family molybdoenzyme membrane anchor subunit n=1 Tax=Adlercreutzia sp. ZJ304 TaxID=2709791 RepID=UPI0013EACFBA|nr:NrfD/PsrC family molybdoenzyme membrane anchor subunit [Adlercreutzia sp. ZJ304]